VKNTRIAFVVSSGRSGTALLGQKLLPALNTDGLQVEATHEYHCTQVQEWAVRYHSGVMSRQEVQPLLWRLYESARYHSEAPLFVDVSNKLSWHITALTELWPDAKFVHIIRGGPQTCLSFYHKLKAECYTDRGVKALHHWLARSSGVIPPQEKEWWWPMPHLDSPFLGDFIWSWGRWQRICWYWAEVNRVIGKSLENYVRPKNRMTVRLEDLVGDSGATWLELVTFLGLNWVDVDSLLARPHNVGWLAEYEMTDSQEGQFWKLCGKVQEKYYSGV